MTWQLTARWNPWKSRLRHSVSNRGFSKFEVYSVSHSHCNSHPHPHTRTLSNQSTLSATHSHRLLPCAFAPPVVDSSATPGALTLTATHTHTHTLSLSNQSTLSATHSHRHSQCQTKPKHSKPRTPTAALPLPRTPTAALPLRTASRAYSTWNKWPSGEILQSAR